VQLGAKILLTIGLLCDAILGLSSLCHDAFTAYLAGTRSPLTVVGALHGSRMSSSEYVCSRHDRDGFQSIAGLLETTEASSIDMTMDQNHDGIYFSVGDSRVNSAKGGMKCSGPKGGLWVTVQ
jgi:hypothetical protein